MPVKIKSITSWLLIQSSIRQMVNAMASVISKHDNLSVAVVTNRKKRSGLVPEYYVYRLFYWVFFYMRVKIEIGNLLAGKLHQNAEK